MSTSTYLEDNMQTTCPHCDSVFLVSQDNLNEAQGQVKCSQCLETFNALLSLENFYGDIDNIQTTNILESEAKTESAIEPPSTDKKEEPVNNASLPPSNLDYQESLPSVSLREAMYGKGHKSNSSLKTLLLTASLLLLTITAVIQIVYYQRYTLVSTAQYQQQILNLCQILPCDKSRFSNLSQIKLIERNVFTHPTQNKALMVTGSLINQAPFAQSIPNLLISLSDTQGNLIANRLFQPKEYLSNIKLSELLPDQPVQFQLELIDPGNKALTYEFEFIS